MKTLKSTFLLAGTASALLLAAVSLTQAQTLWNGSTIDFYNPAGGPGDELTPNVVINRGGSGGLYNSVTESSATGGVSPEDTLWATISSPETLTLNLVTNLSYSACPLEAGNHPPGYVGTTFVVQLVNEGIYLELTLTEWGGQSQSGNNDFEYTRTTPDVAPPAPTATITNPAANAVFSAPANVHVGADAEVSSGTVTNVQFFANNSSFGSVSAAPFILTADNLVAGAYSLTVVATAAGISTTSSPVNITVVTPVTIGLTNFVRTSGSQFQFSYSANAGLRYIIQRASKLNPGNWVSLTTNTAASNPVVFLDVDATNNPAYYRVGRVPNP